MSEPRNSAAGAGAAAQQRHPLLADEAVRQRLRRRKRHDRRSALLIGAIGIALTCLVVASSTSRARVDGFTVTTVRLEVYFDPAVIKPRHGRRRGAGGPQAWRADYAALWRER